MIFYMEKPRNYVTRCIEKKIEKLLNIMPAILIEGPKGSGKSTTGYVFSSSQIYFQDPDESERLLDMARIKPSLLLDGKKPILLDEWQMAPVMWDAIRFYSDKNFGEPGCFILTGSTAPLKEDLDKIKHTGTGRIASIVMRTMSLSESGDSTNEVSLSSLTSNVSEISGRSVLELEDVAKVLVRGGWPLAVRGKDYSGEYAKSYIDAICSRDASRVSEVNIDADVMRSLLNAISRSVATATSLQTIRADMAENNSKIGENGIYSYLEALRKLFVSEDLEAWNPNLRSKTVIRTTAVRHFTDPSIATASLNATYADLLNDPRTFGFLFESLCIRDLRIYADQLGAKIRHYHDKSGLEADSIMVFDDGRWAAFEIKLGQHWVDEAAISLLKLKEKVSSDPIFLMVIVPDGFAYRRDDGVFVVPITCLCP